MLPDHAVRGPVDAGEVGVRVAELQRDGPVGNGAAAGELRFGVHEPARDRDLGVVGRLRHELVDRGAGERNQLGAAGRGRVLDVRGRVTDAIEEAVDLVVAESRAVLVGFELRREGEGAPGGV